MKNKTILVTGATGKTGSRVAELLQIRGHDVRAVSRSTHMPFDWNDQRTWKPALQGVSAVFVVAPDLGSTEVADQIRSFAELAVDHGATRAVIASIPDNDSEGSQAARHIEDQLSAAGLDVVGHEVLATGASMR